MLANVLKFSGLWGIAHNTDIPKKTDPFNYHFPVLFTLHLNEPKSARACSCRKDKK